MGIPEQNAAYRAGYADGTHELSDLTAQLAAAKTALEQAEAARDEARTVLAEVRTTLRHLCAESGDNEWPDELHLSDVIDKHLVRHLVSRADAAEHARDEAVASAAVWRSHLVEVAQYWAVTECPNQKPCCPDCASEGHCVFQLLWDDLRLDTKGVGADLLARVRRLEAIEKAAEQCYPLEGVYMGDVVTIPADACDRLMAALATQPGTEVKQ